MSEWLPIETCPLDGFFLVHEDGAIRTMLRVDGRWEHLGIPVIKDEWGDSIAAPHYARMNPGKQLVISDCIYSPTHWMEVPDAPPPPLDALSNDG